jgi:threonine/homoserine/homoserine lactone efflux protein
LRPFCFEPEPLALTLLDDPSRLFTFLGIMAVMAATPGPANLFSIATGIAGGPKTVLAGVAGMLSGTLVWFMAAALGLGALVVTFPRTFHVLTFMGAGYLLWLGSQSIWSGLKGADHQDLKVSLQTRTASKRKAYLDGLMVQITNPKALVFFSAVLPPFIDPHQPFGPQLAVFAAANIGMDFVTMNAYGLGGTALAHRLSEPRFQRLFYVVVGALLISAAGMILFRLG